MPKTNLLYKTYIYRSFKDEFSLLGRLHWFFIHATTLAKSKVNETYNLYGEDYLDIIMPLSDFDNGRLHITNSQYIALGDEYIAHMRLLLLVKGCALLEGYIHRYTEYFILSPDYKYKGGKFNQLNTVGKAMAKPALVSNLNESLKYIAQLMNRSFGTDLPIVNEAYQIRCAAAHNGGIVDQETARKVPKYARHIGERILLTWDELNGYLKAFQSIALNIEETLSVSILRNVEINWLLQDILDADNTLLIADARRLLMQEYNIQQGVPAANNLRRTFGKR